MGVVQDRIWGIFSGHTGEGSGWNTTSLLRMGWDFELCVGSGGCREVVSGHGAWVSSVALSASGTVGVTVSGDETGVVWDLHTGGFLKVLEGHSGDVRSVVLTRHGRYTPLSPACPEAACP